MSNLFWYRLFVFLVGVNLFCADALVYKGITDNPTLFFNASFSVVIAGMCFGRVRQYKKLL